jgi:hypothetical protein
VAAWRRMGLGSPFPRGVSRRDMPLRFHGSRCLLQFNHQLFEILLFPQRLQIIIRFEMVKIFIALGDRLPQQFDSADGVLFGERGLGSASAPRRQTRECRASIPLRRDNRPVVRSLGSITGDLRSANKRAVGHQLPPAPSNSCRALHGKHGTNGGQVSIQDSTIRRGRPLGMHANAP